MSSTTITTRADPGHTKARSFVTRLAAYDPAMPLGALLVLLYLYENRKTDKGVTLKALRKDLKMTSTVATRSIYYWTERTIDVHLNTKSVGAEL